MHGATDVLAALAEIAASGDDRAKRARVECDRVDAFTADDLLFLQPCAQALAPLWS